MPEGGKEVKTLKKALNFLFCELNNPHPIGHVLALASVMALMLSIAFASDQTSSIAFFKTSSPSAGAVIKTDGTMEDSQGCEGHRCPASRRKR